MSEPAIDSPEPWYRGPAFLLLATLLTVYLVDTFLGNRGWGAHLANLLLMVALFLGVRKITRSSRALRVTIATMVAGLLGKTIAIVILGRDAFVWDQVSNLVFYAVVLALLLWAVANAERVSADTVFAACCVFLLIGMVWACAFVLVHHVNPVAFSLGPEDAADPAAALLHFSFTTLTTVGYGSISPMSPMARTLADLEALIAQLYLAIAIARLVSLEIEDSRKARSA